MSAEMFLFFMVIFVALSQGEMLITPPMYAHMIHHLLALAKGRVCVALEVNFSYLNKDLHCFLIWLIIMY